MYEIDTSGLSCPIPVVETKKALKEHPEGVDVLVDSNACKENVSRFAIASGYVPVVQKMDTKWKIQIRKKSL